MFVFLQEDTIKCRSFLLYTGQVNAWTALPSSYAVEVEDEHDIASAVKFAKDHNIRLVVKGTGT